ncbi:sensor histidine kinase [Janthinobacterium agaricidamnosum]|uniref:Histidine kinase-, DNA gyrase B-, and HSP90-like ATPase family protein n=1 Tax=Janthinobacterium agaricidamnosum NBRC 102515 = DSM 9628 TaxID=1349767 RepID=W0V7I2_9BURK|nr:histidine kinase [Janthinobacterium agaricidamnosum]CDG84794.1 histidine kinase-, DNA gyrase B-, and HSP90-like ATPase family protein [Janthinobacterium agaricidamnosum NBRC 102515 = DSM 9628]
MRQSDIIVKKPAGYPLRRLASDFKHAVAFNVICALIITFVMNSGYYFFENLVISMCIGGIAFLLIDGIRLALWGDSIRPNWGKFLALVAVSVPLAQLGGGALADWLLGDSYTGMRSLSQPRTMGLMVFTLMATGAAVLFFSSREKMIRLQAAAAEEKARAELVARQAMQAQLQLLQAQIEPHMLFNTLANLQGLIAYDTERAQLLLDHLIQYLRTTLTSSRAGSTTLGQEFSLMQAYLGLMAIRMGQRLTYTLQLPEALSQLQLPPMLLQPLVENAIQHGLEPKIDGGHIDVGARRDGAMLLLTVSDNGLGPDHPGQARGTQLGLSNIRERLLAMYGEQAQLSLRAGQPEGATALLTLPITTP